MYFIVPDYSACDLYPVLDVVIQHTDLSYLSDAEEGLLFKFLFDLSERVPFEIREICCHRDVTVKVRE